MKARRLAVVQQQLDKKKSELDEQKQAIALTQEAVRQDAEKKKGSVGALGPGKRNPSTRAQTDGSGSATTAEDA